MHPTVKARLMTVVVLAVVCGSAALLCSAHFQHHHPDFVHHRSHGWIVLSFAEIAMQLALAGLPSRLLSIGAGVLAGGALSNLLWALGHHDVVSNSFVVGYADRGVAFNLADVFALSGIAVLTLALMRLTVRHRQLLPQSTVAVRLVRRLLAARR